MERRFWKCSALVGREKKDRGKCGVLTKKGGLNSTSGVLTERGEGVDGRMIAGGADNCTCLAARELLLLRSQKQSCCLQEHKADICRVRGTRHNAAVGKLGRRAKVRSNNIARVKNRFNSNFQQYQRFYGQGCKSVK